MLTKNLYSILVDLCTSSVRSRLLLSISNDLKPTTTVLIYIIFQPSDVTVQSIQCLEAFFNSHTGSAALGNLRVECLLFSYFRIKCVQIRTDLKVYRKFYLDNHLLLFICDLLWNTVFLFES